MFKTLLISLMVAVGAMSNDVPSVVSDNEIDIYFMYSVDDGTYWLDPNAENNCENVIWIDDVSLAEWDVNKEELHHGNKMIGTFTSDGWELLGMKDSKE